MTEKYAWTRAERRVLDRLTTPLKIQQFLDTVAYSADPIYRCPRSVLRDRKANCFDGAVFAAFALGRIGCPPTMLEMRAVRDDDHLIAVYRRAGHLGAVAKSNYSGLRFREPIHRTLRELVLTYFDAYFNVLGEKTLRTYSVLYDLRRFDELQWPFRDEALETIDERVYASRHYPLLTEDQVGALSPVDDRTLKAGTLGSDPDGLYRP